MKLLTLGAAALLIAGTASAASANAFDVDLSLGYSRLRIDGPGAKDLDKDDGAAIQLAFMGPAPQTPSFRFGFGLELSGYRNDFHVTDTNGFERHRFDQIGMVVPELRIGYYVPIGHFFIEPSIGVGLAIADYSTGHVHRYHHDNNDSYDDIDSDTLRLNAAVHPTLQIGYASDHWAVGLQTSYLYTHLHFKDGIGGDVSELYGGAFFRWSY